MDVEGKAYLYSKWFVLELPVTLFDPAYSDWEEPRGDVQTWRSVMPEGEGEYASASRWTNPEDNLALVKLISGAGVAIIHPSIYDVVMKQLPEPEFRVFDGEHSFVAIFSAGVMVGGVAQVKL